MPSFYEATLTKLELPKDASVLVVCGGELDRDVFLQCGFTHVTISNLDERVKGHEFAPYAWSFQDAEDLSYEAGSFDSAVVHAGLHHCASPHGALLEMYRVARKGIVAFEARDSLLMRLAIACKRVPSYEACAVRAHAFKYGGVRNSAVPNFIYRWTENEVRKTIASYAPQSPPVIRFFYGLRLPTERLPFRSHRSLSFLSNIAEFLVRALARLFQRQGNLFAFYVEKSDAAALFPWLKTATEFDPTYTGL